jgi:hypothetical protein
MRFRNLALPALLAAGGIVVWLVYSAIWLNTIAAKTSQSYIKVLVDFASWNFLPALALSLFFFCLYAEGSGRIGSEVRAKAVIVSSSLMVLYVAGGILNLGLYAFALWTTPKLDLDRSFLANRLFYLICESFWVVLLIVFATKRGTAARRAIPRVAGILTAFTLCTAVWTSVQLYTHHDPLGLALRNYAVFLLGCATQLLFLVVVWRRCRPDFPIHENVVS